MGDVRSVGRPHEHFPVVGEAFGGPLGAQGRLVAHLEAHAHGHGAAEGRARPPDWSPSRASALRLWPMPVPHPAARKHAAPPLAPCCLQPIVAIGGMRANLTAVDTFRCLVRAVFRRGGVCVGPIMALRVSGFGFVLFVLYALFGEC